MKTVVITGASSGIGELTARKMAQKGYNIVLAARREHLLEKIAKQCQEEFGVKALAVAADVSKKEEVERVAAHAVQRFGGFDIWINNAGVIMYGRFLDISPEEFRQVMETNLFGYAYGAREALTQFRAQGRGTLINVASGYGAVPAPYASAYITSKFAVRGLSASLREEMSAEGAKDIHVCTVLPATMDTPVYDNAGNRMGRPVRALPPVYNPELVADAIADLTVDPKAEVAVTGSLRIPMMIYNLLPGFFTAAFAKYVDSFGFKKGALAPNSSGNLFAPSNHKGIRGGWKTTRQHLAKSLKILLVVAGVILAWRAVSSDGKEQP